MRDIPLGICLLLLFAPAAAAQQLNDRDFRFEIAEPAFPEGTGPRVCIDEAHYNIHTVDRLGAPLSRILRADGFRVGRLAEAISETALAACDIVILGNPNAMAPEAQGFWAYPHAPALSRPELDPLVQWVRGGGALLLSADHSPGAGAAAGLTALLGVQTLDGWGDNTPQGIYPEIFRRSDGLLADHPILQGRTPTERIDSIATWSGGAFVASEHYEPLVTYGPSATGWVRLGEMGQELHEIPDDEWPRFDISGWLLGATRRWGRGRVVIFGDVTACTAQFYGPEKYRVGMNHPAAGQNAQFCLNMVRWLAGILPHNDRRN